MGGQASSNTKDVTKTTTQSYADSYNRTLTVNRTFDNAGNTNVYFNSPGAGNSGGGGMGNMVLPLAIAGVAALGGVMFLTMRSK